MWGTIGFSQASACGFCPYVHSLSAFCEERNEDFISESLKDATSRKKNAEQMQFCYGSLGTPSVKRFLLPVSLHMDLEAAIPHKLHGAKGAMEGLHAGMGADMLDEVVLVPEGLVAVVTLVWTLARMRSLVVLYGIGVRRGVVAHGTLPQAFSTARAPKRRSATGAMYDERICAVGRGTTSANRNVKKMGE